MREKRKLIMVICCLVCLLQAQAITTENPYQPIVDRNVFALRPPPPPPTEDELAAKQPPPNIFLTGITTIFGNKRVLLKTTPTAGPSKPGAEKPTEESYVLTEGQRDGDVEVLQIDEKAGTVKIRLAGKEMTLDFENNGVKAVASAPAPGQPGAPGMPPTGLIRPAGFNAPPRPTSVPGTTRSMSNIPGRPMRLESSSGSLTPTANRTPAMYGGYSAGRVASTPSGGLSFGGGSSASSRIANRNQNTEQPRLSPVEQEAFTEIQRKAYQMEKSPLADLLPPTRGSLPPLPGAGQPPNPSP